MITRLVRGFSSRFRIVLYRHKGVRFLGRAWLGAIEIPRHHKAISLGDGAAVDRGVVLLATSPQAQIVIGARTYLNRYTMLDANGRIEIGERTMVGPFGYITDHDHSFGSGHAPADGPLTTEPTRLGARCWIGAHVTILKGVTIGDGTVVGAGSVVTKSLPTGVIAAGNPARVLRQIAP
jgi:acetyltransferase-like isoleucine patch superfamily enzyme